jgi:FkbM family methyltransferase
MGQELPGRSVAVLTARTREYIAGTILGYRRLLMALRLRLGQNAAIVRTAIGPMTVDLEDKGVGQPIFLHRSWENDETAYLKINVVPDSLFLDIGANIGYYTALASNLVGAAGRVVAFEPNRHNFELLERNVALNRCENVTMYQLALGEAEDHLWLYKSNTNFGDHRFSIHDFEKEREREMVPIRRLDSFLDTLAPGKRIAIKMDVQGFETQVIRGMARVLDERDVYLILAEYCPTLISLSGDNPGDMLRLFEEAGFQPHILGTNGATQGVQYREIPERMPYWESVTGPFLNLIFRRS